MNNRDYFIHAGSHGWFSQNLPLPNEFYALKEAIRIAEQDDFSVKQSHVNSNWRPRTDGPLLREERELSC